MAQANFYVAPAPLGSDSNNGTSATSCGTNCGPWLTFAHANATWAGTAGVVIHFADGTYVGPSNTACGSDGTSSFCISRTGTSTNPIVYQCDNGLFGNAGHPGVAGHCLLRSSSDVNNQQIVGTVGANWITIQGFDIGGDAAHPATTQQTAITMYAKDGSSQHMTVNYNYMHDVARLAPASDNPTEGAGCPPSGMVDFDSAFPAVSSTIPQFGTFIGNYVNNYGDITNANCNQAHAMYIGAGPFATVMNNIAGNAPGSAIKLYPSNCSSVVSNNIAYHSGWWGILVDSSGDSRNDGCIATGVPTGKSTIDNNIIIDTGFNKACGAIALADGSANLFGNNLFLGPTPNGADVPVLNCSSTPVQGNVSGAIVTGTLNLANSGATAANTFVSYSDTPTASTDFHLKSGSVAIAAGTRTCFSGGLTPCTPTIDFYDATRPTALSIGPIEFAGSGSPVVSITPSTVAFGNQTVGTPATLPTVVKNTGTSSLIISNIVITSGDYAQTNNCPTTLGASLSCTINVTFTPSVTGSRTGTVTITDNAANTPQMIPLTGTGVSSGITLSPPTTVAFGNQTVGIPSATMFETITSSGTVALNLTAAFTITGPNAGDFAFAGVGTCHEPSSVPVGSSCTVSLLFSPAAAGSRTATLNIFDDAPGNPHTITLTGTGVNPAPSVLLNPTSLTFAPELVNTTSTAQTVTLTNNGTAALAISSIAVTP